MNQKKELFLTNISTSIWILNNLKNHGAFFFHTHFFIDSDYCHLSHIHTTNLEAPVNLTCKLGETPHRCKQQMPTPEREGQGKMLTTAPSELIRALFFLGFVFWASKLTLGGKINFKDQQSTFFFTTVHINPVA